MAFVIDSYSETNQNDTDDMYGARTGRGQSFANTDECYLSSAKFYLSKTGSPPGTLYCRLYAHTGTYGTSSLPTGSVLDQSSMSASSLGTSFALVTFNFTGGYILQPNTKYCISLYYNEGGSDASNKVNVGADTTSPTHGGNYFFDNGGGWTTSTADGCFYVYGETGPSGTFLLNLV